MDIGFESLKDALGDSNEDTFEISKLVLEDGAYIDLFLASFSALHIGPDPDNNDEPTLWYTMPYNNMSPDREFMRVQVRRFLTGHIVTPKLHHHIGSYWYDGLLWHVYLDRTEKVANERKEMSSALQEISKDLAQFVANNLETPGGFNSLDTSNDDIPDFLKKIISEMDSEGGQS